MRRRPVAPKIRSGLGSLPPVNSGAGPKRQVLRPICGSLILAGTIIAAVGFRVPWAREVSYMCIEPPRPCEPYYVIPPLPGALIFALPAEIAALSVLGLLVRGRAGLIIASITASLAALAQGVLVVLLVETAWWYRYPAFQFEPGHT